MLEARPIPLVGIFSAEAAQLEHFFAALPPSSGLAFVVVAWLEGASGG